MAERTVARRQAGGVGLADTSTLAAIREVLAGFQARRVAAAVAPLARPVETSARLEPVERHPEAQEVPAAPEQPVNVVATAEAADPWSLEAGELSVVAAVEWHPEARLAPRPGE